MKEGGGGFLSIAHVMIILGMYGGGGAGNGSDECVGVMVKDLQHEGHREVGLGVCGGFGWFGWFGL
jgi:hypothetical protein